MKCVQNQHVCRQTATVVVSKMLVLVLTLWLFRRKEQNIVVDSLRVMILSWSNNIRSVYKLF